MSEDREELRSMILADQLQKAKAEIERLRAALTDASTRIAEIMDRRDGTIRDTAWGDLDNLRLDALLAAEAAGGGE